MCVIINCQVLGIEQQSSSSSTQYPLFFFMNEFLLQCVCVQSVPKNILAFNTFPHVQKHVWSTQYT
jgi:hypothetical protein